MSRWSPLSVEMILDIRRRAAEGDTLRTIADGTGLTRHTVKCVVRGISYKQVGGPITPHSRIWHGVADTAGHNSWEGIVQRCTNPNNSNYRHYGGRGITVCERWRSFALFIQDVGPRPSLRHTIDRIDNSGNYEPANVRWVTQSRQTRNTRVNRMLEFRGERMCLADAAAKYGIHHAAVRSRLSLGWSVERALTEPLDTKRSNERKRASK